MDERLSSLRNPSHTMVMGVLNITEDSFSDGGLWLEASAAAEHGRQMVREGASIIDIGAESTRPGAVRVEEETEKARIVTAVNNLVGLGVPLSIDTTRASVASAALDAGALAFSLGGSGPTVFAIVEENGPAVADAISGAFAGHGIGSTAYCTKIGKGAEVLALE